MLFNKTGKTDEVKWYLATVDIRTQERFSIGIEAVFGSTYFSTIGVDDIVFKECAPSESFLDNFSSG